MYNVAIIPNSVITKRDLRYLPLTPRPWNRPAELKAQKDPTHIQSYPQPSPTPPHLSLIVDSPRCNKNQWTSNILLWTYSSPFQKIVGLEPPNIPSPPPTSSQKSTCFFWLQYNFSIHVLNRGTMKIIFVCFSKIIGLLVDCRELSNNTFICEIWWIHIFNSLLDQTWCW